jgi:energy-coupling factor transport system ATP-binding protein
MSIRVTDLTHVYHQGTPLERRALDGVNLLVEPGSWVSVVGHTGSGKSTLAQHLNGLLFATRGVVEVDGVFLREDAPELLRKARKKVGLVFQYPEQQLFAETVSEEIAFAPRNWGIPKERLPEVVHAAAACVGLEKSLLGMNPFNLSGGQKRRVALASVLASEPDYLVLDEPTAGLDGKGRKELLSLLSRFVREGKGVVLVTHDLDTALAHSHRILVLEDGKVFALGTPQEVLNALVGASVRGIVLPPVVELSQGLKQRGWNVPLTPDATTLYALIAKEGKRCDS